MAYNPADYINGVDQRTESQKIRDEKIDAAKVKADLDRRAVAAKKAKARRQDEAMGGKNLPQSPSPSDIQAGHFRTTNYTKPIK
jgi:hypothetical protein